MVLTSKSMAKSLAVLLHSFDWSDLPKQTPGVFLSVAVAGGSNWLALGRSHCAASFQELTG